MRRVEVRPAPSPSTRSTPPRPPAAPERTDPGGPARPGVGLAERARRWLSRWIFSPLQGTTFRLWWPVLARNWAKIPPRYWARTAATTATSLVNGTLAIVEARRYAARLERTRVERPVFVLGHHRSGTTHLWNLLVRNPSISHPNVLQAVFPHTFLLVEDAVGRVARHLTMRTRPQDGVALAPESPSGEEKALCAATFHSNQLVRHFPRDRERASRFLTLRDARAEERRRWCTAFRTFAKKLAFRHGEDRTLIFKAPDHTAKIRHLLDCFPDARFVHIHRHPERVFASSRKLELQAQPYFAYQSQNLDEIDDFIFWRYREMYTAFLEDASLVPEDRFTEVAFADVERDPVSTVERIHEALGLPDFGRALPELTRYVHSLAGYRKNSFEPLSEPILDRIRREWGFAYRRWGYEV